MADAIIRCDDHGTQKPEKYIAKVKPLGYPTSAIICGIKTCPNFGLIWLTRAGLAEYNAGQRTFTLDTNTAKVRAE
jgi:hypothetical protein